MRPLLHPAREAITLAGVLHALSDPARLAIFRRIAGQGKTPIGCTAIMPPDMPRSTRSHHLAVLREAGLIRCEKRGTELMNTARTQDVQARFPGLLKAVLRAAEE